MGVYISSNTQHLAENVLLVLFIYFFFINIICTSKFDQVYGIFLEKKSQGVVNGRNRVFFFNNKEKRKITRVVHARRYCCWEKKVYKFLFCRPGELRFSPTEIYNTSLNFLSLFNNTFARGSEGDYRGGQPLTINSHRNKKL